jgi:hypothetical protein
MLDLIYVSLTIAFFALMLAYVRGCRMLGSRNGGEDSHER